MCISVQNFPHTTFSCTFSRMQFCFSWLSRYNNLRKCVSFKFAFNLTSIFLLLKVPMHTALFFLVYTMRHKKLTSFQLFFCQNHSLAALSHCYRSMQTNLQLIIIFLLPLFDDAAQVTHAFQLFFPLNLVKHEKKHRFFKRFFFLQHGAPHEISQLGHTNFLRLLHPCCSI